MNTDTENVKLLTRRKLIKRLVLTGVLSPLAVTGYAHEIEPRLIQVARVDMPLDNLPAEAVGLRIGHLSDTHNYSSKSEAIIHQATELLLAQSPDIVFLTGDFITRYPYKFMPGAADALAPLANVKHGAYAVLGNHDWWAGDHRFVEKELERVGIHVLKNQSTHLASRNLWLTGLETRCNNLPNPHKALIGVPDEAFKLMLIHEPDYADEAPAGFAAQFSGHSHGGQIRFPVLPPTHTPKYGRKYPEGLQQAPNHPVYTTRGIGLIGPKFRLFCPPEVGLITLKLK